MYMYKSLVKSVIQGWIDAITAVWFWIGYNKFRLLPKEIYLSVKEIVKVAF